MQSKTGGSREHFFPHINKKPLVSIVIVTFNADKYLKDGIESIISQSFKNIDLVIIDGESTDKTLKVIRTYEKYISYWCSEPDKGIYHAMNKAVKLLKGQWVLFLGADDRLLNGFSQLAEKLEDPNTLYYGDCMINEQSLGGEFSAYRLAKMNICHQALFYPAKIFKLKKYAVKYQVFADYALNIQCWGDPLINRKYFSFPITRYNPNGFSATTSDNLFKTDKPKWIKKYLGRIIYIRYLIRRWKEARKRDSNFF